MSGPDGPARPDPCQGRPPCWSRRRPPRSTAACARRSATPNS